MALIVLPRNQDEETRTRAQALFQAAVSDPLTVILILFGDGPSIEEALGICVARASVKMEIRRVVWVPDPSVLSEEQVEAFGLPGKAAVTVGLSDRIAASLTLARAKIRLHVEKAFLAAEAS